MQTQIDALKKEVALQTSHTLLLLAIAKSGSLTAAACNIEDEIRKILLPPEVERHESSIRQQACDLLRHYFPEKYRRSDGTSA